MHTRTGAWPLRWCQHQLKFGMAIPTEHDNQRLAINLPETESVEEGLVEVFSLSESMLLMLGDSWCAYVYGVFGCRFSALENEEVLKIICTSCTLMRLISEAL